MAKFGEGDPRWLVEEREDGTNVNAWHWKEKDCLAWARARLAELLGGLVLVSGSAGSARTTGLKSVEGDAILNVRKAKLIASYELDIKVDWEGSTADGRAGSGVLQLPYVADENHDEDPEIRVLLPEETAAALALKQAILVEGKPAICKAIHTFVKELRAGVPTQASKQGGGGSDGAAGRAAAASNGSGAAAAPAAAGAANAHGAQAAPAAAAAAKAAKREGGRSTVKLTERFYARPQDIYECFVVQGRLQAFTRSPAQVDPQPGGKFSWFNGHVLGEFVELVPAQRIEMRWRFNNWENECLSKVVITLSETEPGNTVLQLDQTGLPAEDKYGNSDVQQQVEEGWKRQVFGMIRQVFGYGV